MGGRGNKEGTHRHREHRGGSITAGNPRKHTGNRDSRPNYRATRKEAVELGKILHSCEDDLVVRLSVRDIPYPNAPVLDKKEHVVGKIDEVFGPLNEVYTSIKLEGTTDPGKYGAGDILYIHSDRFIPKSRFLSREETEKSKEKRDTSSGKGKPGSRPGHRNTVKSDYKGNRRGDK